MTGEDRRKAGEQKSVSDPDYIKRRLDLFDQRLDNIDTIVSAVVERLMKSNPVTLNITCPGCGRNLEVTFSGSTKLKM